MPSADFPLPKPNPTVVFKQLEEGGVLLSTRDEVYFGVNPVGARIWSLLPPETNTFDEMCTVLQREYSDVGVERLRRDAKTFLEDLVAAGLTVEASRSSSVDASEPASSD